MTFTRVVNSFTETTTTPLVKHIQPFIGTTVVDLHTRLRTYDGPNSTVSYLTHNPHTETFSIKVTLDTLNYGLLYPNSVRVDVLYSVDMASVTKPIGLNYMPALDDMIKY